jgi:hypothetical protein
MAVLNIMTPGYELGGTATQYVPNPWGTPDSPACDVWVLCTMTAFQINDTAALAGYGIIEYEYVDSNGQVQQVQIADPSNLSNVIPEYLFQSYFIQNMISVTLAIITYNTGASGTVTLFQWG